MATAIHATKGSTSGSKNHVPGAALRKGIFWDKHAGQFACRIGYKLDEQTGQRVRDVVYRLGSNENAAIIGHANRAGLWEHIVGDWPHYRDTIRPGLPEAIRESADLSKPVWIAKEWLDNTLVESKKGLADTVKGHADTLTTQIDRAKNTLKVEIASPARPWLDMVPPALRSRVLQAIQPAANEVKGIAPDARRLTLRQAATEFLAYKKLSLLSRICGRVSARAGRRVGDIGLFSGLLPFGSRRLF
jgi:hypothetical protein